MISVRLRSGGKRSRRSARRVAAGISVGRVALGAAVLVRPDALARGLGVDTVTARRLDWLGQMFAARDVALGAGAVHALVTRRPMRPWLWAQVLADVVDAAALARAAQVGRVDAPKALAAAATAASSAMAGVTAARAVDADGG